MTRYHLDAITGKRIAYTAEEETAKDAEEAATKIEKDKILYQKLRTGEAGIRGKTNTTYPEISEQLDLLWHAIDADADLKVKLAGFYNAIKAVKDANPKP
tara:strand:+ start:216 stop:515 length:300 start_codon:yes stop_codon:yes gene_type:complete